jgi:LmbE family N-acetylglucosaminyl deacetylase
MKPAAPIVLALLFATASAQTTRTSVPARANQFTDPANLGGERVKPRDGRELPVDQGALGLQQLLRRLNTRASIMNIVAHPDDEDGGMMTLYSRGMGARVADLSLTRGEGGQNAMTADFEDALGLLRTQELLSCDRYSGVDQFFGTEVDFGFSKTKEEAFSKWTHERVLYDVVRAIRIYRPLVLTSTWVGGVTDGHGQHQVSGEIAQEAFNKAGDPKVFPEMTAEGILPWQPLKVYARVSQAAITAQGLFDYATAQYTPARFQNYVTGEVSATPPSVDVVVHEGDTDPLLADTDGKPRSYVQFARIGLSQQKSQMGPGGRMPPAGKFDVSYHRYGSAPNGGQHSQLDPHFNGEPTFFKDIDTSITGIATLAPHAPSTLRRSLNMLQQQIDLAFCALSCVGRANPTYVAPLLADAMRSLDNLLSDVVKFDAPEIERANVLHELRVKRVQMNDALVLALGISVSTQLAKDNPSECTRAIVPGCIAHVNTIFLNGSIAPVRVISDFTSYTGQSDSERTFAPSTAMLKQRERLWPERSFFEQGWGGPSVLDLNQPSKSYSFDLARAEGRPYFTRPNIEQPFYDLLDPSLRLSPETPHNSFWTKFSYAAEELIAGHIVTTSGNPDGPGDPLVVEPLLSIAISPGAIVKPRSEPIVTINVKVQNESQQQNKLPVYVGLKLPSGWTTQPQTGNDTFHEPHETLNIPFTLTPTPVEEKDDTVSATAETLDGPISEGFRSIGYPGIAPTHFYKPAAIRIVPIDLKQPAARRIGYLPGTGDAVPEALASIGLKPEMLTVADLTPDKLKQYDSVILGVRTYAAHPDLHGAPTQALLNYAKSGGNVVVQYQATEFTGDDAPYPLALAHYAGTVVDETAPVKLLDTGSPLLTTPNKVTPADFNGWVEERGHGFLQTWDSHYSAPTETHDPGQDPQRGGLITVKLGEGRWTYLAFAVYRQLPEAVPGAFRLFVNLLQK